MDYIQWYSTWHLKRKHERLGQAFVNDFIKSPWPELFYETDERVANGMIVDWLVAHQYYPNLPEKCQ